MAVSEIGAWSFFCESGTHHRNRRVSPPKTPLLGIPIPITKCILQNPIRFSATERSCVVPRALDPQTGDDENNSNTTSQEDLAYVAKLVAGSFVGAAAIKYGSALFPEITRPNIVQALIIIIAPVLVAVLLLIKESSQDTEET